MKELFEKIVKDVIFKEQEHSDHSYASEMGYCERKLWYKRMGYPSSHNFSTAVNFAQGTAIHELIQGMFETYVAPKLGFRAFKEIRINIGNIHGFLDMMLVNKDEIHIIEIKTTKMLPNEPLPHHIRQLNTYLAPYILNQDKHHKAVRGTLYYVEKAIMYGNSPQREFDVQFDKALYDETMEKADRLEHALKYNILPPADALINKNYWECRLCSFFTACRNAGRDPVDMSGETQ